jgi:hypothetical protein
LIGDFEEANEMNMPGFTADVTLHKRSECYYQKAGNVVASRNGILPARRIPITRHSKARNYCKQIGGIYFSESGTSATYGCVSDNADHGIFCGGDTDEDMRTCDIW